MNLVLEEQSIRQAIRAALDSSMSVPQAPWSREFVEEAVLAELTVTGPGSSSEPGDQTFMPDNAASTSSSSRSSSNSRAMDPAENGSTGMQVSLMPGIMQLLEQFAQAAAMQPSNNSSSSSKADSSQASSKAAGKQSSSSGSKRSSKRGQAGHGSASSVDDSMLAEEAVVNEQVAMMFGQLLQENYQQVEAADVSAFGGKLLREVSRLVDAAAAAQQDDVEGLCQLCEREMPLTKHHLIPRDVHKDFKKKGFGFNDLQSGVMVCRPCHSAIHKAVPDNKDLGQHYRTLDALRQHEEISKFAAWARRQRVTSKADLDSAHFRYRR